MAIFNSKLLNYQRVTNDIMREIHWKIMLGTIIGTYIKNKSNNHWKITG